MLSPTPQAIDLNESVKSILAQKSQALWSISPETSVYEAMAVMSERRIGALVVLSAERLVGIITERDYARKVVLKARQSRETEVREIMTTPVLFVTPEQTIGQCMYVMNARQIRYLPVLEADRVIGAQDDTIRQLHNYITGSYPA
jgi:CBS domain-containing protein